MKKLFLISVLALGVATSGFAQDKKEKCKKGKHECTETCKKAKHECTEICKDGKHVYKHGEKKHKCSEECHKKMQ